MSNSFNEDYNTYLLEKSILETSNPPINNIEETENLTKKLDNIDDIDNIDNIDNIDDIDNFVDKKKHQNIDKTTEIKAISNLEEILNNKDNLKKNIQNTLLELENTNDLLQGGNNKIIGGGSGSYTVNGNYTINSSASNGIFGLEITPNISGNSTISSNYNTNNITTQVKNASSLKVFTVTQEFYYAIEDNQQLKYTKIYSVNGVKKTETATYYVSKIENSTTIKLRATEAADGADIEITADNNTTSITLTNPDGTLIQNKLQFIQICNNLNQGIYTNFNSSNQKNWSYIMKNYLVNLLEKTSSDIPPPLEQISKIETAINNQQFTTTTTTYNIDLSQIKLKSDLNTEAKIINNINNLLLKIPYKYFLTDLQLFTSNNKEIRYITAIILIILFGICIYKLNLSNYDKLSDYNPLILQISKWVLFSIISILILFMEIGGKLFDEFSIDGLTINNDITMSFIYISFIILIYGLFNYISKTDNGEITNVYIIVVTICVSIGIIWMGNTIFYKIFPNEEAQKNQLKDILNQKNYYKTYDKNTKKSDNWVQYSFPVMIFLYICTFIYFLNKKPLFIQEQSNLFILFSFIITVILGVIYFITNKSIYIYNLLGSSGIITIILSILILIYKFSNNSGLEAPKIGYNYLLDIIPVYLLLISSIINISTLNINQLVIGASIEVIIRIFIIVYVMLGVTNLSGKDGYLSYHIFILLGCFTMILLSSIDNKIMKIEEFNICYSVISPFMNLLYFMYIVK